MPNWINIKNQTGFPTVTFGVAYASPSGNQYLELGSIAIGTSESYRCQDIPIPEGASCWLYKKIAGSGAHNSIHESESNFNCHYNDSQTAAYNSGADGFSLEIRPN